MQVCPELSSFTHAMRRAATSMSASAATMTGLLPPSSTVTGVNVGAAAAMIFLPTSVPPVNKAWSKPWANRAWVTAASPSTTRTASASRYSGTSRASTAELAGANSEGLTTAQFPAATAANPTPAHPPLQVLAGIGGLRFRGRDVAEPRVHRRAVKVLGEGCDDLRLAFIAQPLDSTQLVNTPCQPAGATAAEHSVKIAQQRSRI